MVAGVRGECTSLQASLQEQGPFLGAIRDVRRSDGGEEENIALTVANVATPGLQNLTGEYNCFLNAIVQCLWHCAAFRSGMLRLLDPEQLQVGAAHYPRTVTCLMFTTDLKDTQWKVPSTCLAWILAPCGSTWVCRIH